MDLFGTGYVIDHCIAFLANKRKEEQYRCYVTDALKHINEIFANVYGGSYMAVRYAELFNEKPKDTRTGEEIKQHMKDKINSIGGRR